jgi:hypothetical protein
MFLMWCVQSVDLEETLTWLVLPMSRSTTCSQVLPTTTHV